MLAVVLLFFCIQAQAHDFWIAPSEYRLDSPGHVTLQLQIGDNFRGDPFPRDPSHIARFIVVGAGGEERVPGSPGRDPAGAFLAKEEGLYVVGYVSHFRPVTLEAEDFESYLQEEGLQHILKLRRERGEDHTKGIENFSRCAKSLIAVGNLTRESRDLRLGLPLELVTERNPYLTGSDTDFSVRLYFQGKPLSGALVSTFNQENPEEKQMVRSDENGRVTFSLPTSGVWLIKAVHMIRAPAGAEADWQSYWASLTFSLSAPELDGM